MNIRAAKKKSINRLLATIVLVCFMSFTILPTVGDIAVLEAAEFGRSVDFLINMGISLYDQGRFAEAMDHFKKALIINPGSMVAKEFLSQIESALFGVEKETGVSRQLAIEEALNQAESAAGDLKKPRILKQKKLKPLIKKETTAREGLLMKMPEVPAEKKTEPLSIQKTIILDEKIRSGEGVVALELEQDSLIVIRGSNIKRFLNNTPDKLEVSRQDQDNLLVRVIGVGKGIFHVWDNLGRWTFYSSGKQKKIISSSKESYDNLEKPIGLSDSFKMSYYIDWNSFSSGRRLDTTERQTLSIDQGLSLRGDTPYGKYDGSFSIERLNKKYEMDNLTMGLTDAHWAGLEHMNLRLFDYSPKIAAYKFPNADLRGVRVDAPMFDKKISYTAFWGGLPEGSYTRLSPGLGRTKEAYLEGIGVNYVADRNNRYKLYYAHSYGPELTQPVLTNSTFGLSSFHKAGNLNFRSEVANDDIGHISYTTGADFTLPHLNIFMNFSDDDRDFASPLGGESAGGSTSANFGFRISPTQYLSISNSVSATRDRTLYNTDDPKRPNYIWDSLTIWKLDPHTDLELNYNRNDTKGSISPGLTETKRLNLRKKIFFLKPISTTFNYTNSTNKYFKGTTSNYDRDSIGVGMGFNLIGDLYYGINKSFNFIKDRITKERAKSHILDTSLNYYSRIAESPFYGRFRVSFRDEEETESALSYLSGQDRLEFVSELDYRPNPYMSSYLGFRVSNIWAEKEGEDKRIDAEVKCGMRLTWDTGLRWNTKGHVSGFVFDDIDGDGIKDMDEIGIESITIIATTKKTDVTDGKGYYQIKNIVGKKARITMELSSLPKGYTLTTPSFYDIEISHGVCKKLDFGITTRAEIVGVVFVDVDDNNQFGRGDEPISGVVFILDGKDKAATDSTGQYLFRKVSPGEHTISIDLKSLPVKYIPKVALKKKVILDKGATLFNNVPLRISSKD